MCNQMEGLNIHQRGELYGGRHGAWSSRDKAKVAAQVLFQMWECGNMEAGCPLYTLGGTAHGRAPHRHIQL